MKALSFIPILAAFAACISSKPYSASLMFKDGSSAIYMRDSLWFEDTTSLPVGAIVNDSLTLFNTPVVGVLYQKLK